MTVLIKPNSQNKRKWYYGWNGQESLDGKEVQVIESVNPNFSNHFQLDGNASFYIDKEDCYENR
jgi:hypothetical protein